MINDMAKGGSEIGGLADSVGKVEQRFTGAQDTLLRLVRRTINEGVLFN
jgi:hypothetical protein